MSGQDLRDVPVRRNYRSSGTCNTVAESDEHNQGDVQSAVGPEDPGRGSKRLGKETCRCTQGVLWGKCIINALYIMQGVSHASEFP